MPQGARKSAIVIKVGYDADAALAAFAAGLKDAVDLDSIRDDLATVVHQAVEAARVPVWISPRD